MGEGRGRRAGGVAGPGAGRGRQRSNTRRGDIWPAALVAMALAAGQQGLHAAPARVAPRADRVYGQAGFGSRVPAVAPGLHDPAAVAAAPDGGLYVADTANNRVLHYPGRCGPSACAPDRIYGQPSLNTNHAGSGAAGLDGPVAVVPDPTGGLYVADMYNNRVLHYPRRCVHAGCAADRVYGQARLTASRFGAFGYGLSYPAGVAVDPAGGLYVADFQNNRVLHYPRRCPSAGCSADRVYGQPDLDSTFAGDGAVGLDGPVGVAVDPAGGIYVADSLHNRVLHYPRGCRPAGCAADRVYGQPGFAGGATTGSLRDPTGLATGPSGGVYVADTDNNRVLHYPRHCGPVGCAPDRVYGQPDRPGSAPATTAAGLSAPEGVGTDPGGGLYVADTDNNRALHYPGAATHGPR